MSALIINVGVDGLTLFHCVFPQPTLLWALTDSNRRPSACKADALNQLS